MAVEGRPLTIRVLDPDGAPLEHVIVWIDEHGRVVTDGEGRAVYPDMRSDEVRVRVLGGAHPWKLPPDLVPPDPRIVAVEDGEAEFRFGRGIVVEGVVVDPEGNPVKWAQVRALTDPGTSVGVVLTDAEGRFRVAVPVGIPSVDLAVRQNAPGAILMKDLRSVRPGTRNLRIRLERHASYGPR
jgi:hypothetical protein